MISDAEPARPRSIAARITHPDYRGTGTIGLALWCAAALAIGLYSAGLVHNATTFLFAECWAIGGGCVGEPVAVLRVLGRRLTAAACTAVSAANFAAAAVLTLAVLGGWHLQRPVATTILIMLLAGGIQSANAACVRRKLAAAETRAHQARDDGYTAGYDAGYRDAMTAIYAEHQVRLEAIAEAEFALVEDTQELPRMPPVALRALPTLYPQLPRGRSGARRPRGLRG